MWKILYWLVREVPGSTPGSIASRLRIFALRRAGAKIGRGCVVRTSARISSPNRLEMGDRAGIGLRNILSCLGGVSIGDNVMIGTDVIVYTSNHVWSPKLRTYAGQGLELAPVTIGPNSWVGSRVIITSGVSIGTGVTIGAGAVVTKSIQDYAVAVGVPARVVKLKEVL